jgi:DNA polymerase III alpha subunit (gram-positive type)
MGLICYVSDTETTSVDFVNGDVIEASFLRFHLADPGKYEQKTWLLRAMNPDGITEKALTINGHKKEDILGFTKYGKENYKDPNEVISDIEAWISEDEHTKDERFFCGQNPMFDYNMLTELWKKCESESTFPFSNNLIDTIMIAKIIDLTLDHKRGRYNLGSLVKDFGITKRTAHKAAEDTLMTYELLLKMIIPFKTFIEANFRNK